MTPAETLAHGNEFPFDAPDKWWRGPAKPAPPATDWAHAAARGAIADLRLSCYVINRYGHINALDLEPWYYTIRRDVADGAGDSGFDREDAAFIAEVMARH